MGRDELRVVGERLLEQARALRTAFPNLAAMRQVAVGDIGTEPVGEVGRAVALRAALGYLRNEMVLVRDRRADALTVLDDEIANVERLMPRP
jgi:hypothetical protein